MAGGVRPFGIICVPHAQPLRIPHTWWPFASSASHLAAPGGRPRPAAAACCAALRLGRAVGGSSLSTWLLGLRTVPQAHRVYAASWLSCQKPLPPGLPASSPSSPGSLPAAARTRSGPAGRTGLCRPGRCRRQRGGTSSGWPPARGQLGRGWAQQHRQAGGAAAPASGGGGGGGSSHLAAAAWAAPSPACRRPEGLPGPAGGSPSCSGPQFSRGSILVAARWI